MNKAVRERVWGVLRSWFPLGADYSIVMVWPDKNASGGVAIATLGTPPYDMVEHYDFVLARTPLTARDKRSLKIEDENSDVPF